MPTTKKTETTSGPPKPEGMLRHVLLVDKPEFLVHAASLAKMYHDNASQGVKETADHGQNAPASITWKSGDTVCVMTNPTPERMQVMGFKMGGA